MAASSDLATLKSENAAALASLADKTMVRPTLVPVASFVGRITESSPSEGRIHPTMVPS